MVDFDFVLFWKLFKVCCCFSLHLYLCPLQASRAYFGFTLILCWPWIMVMVDGWDFTSVTVRVGCFHSQFPRVAIQQKLCVHMYFVGCAVLLYHAWRLFTTFSHFKIEATGSPPECLMLNEVCRQCKLAWNLILFFFLLLFTKSLSKGDICHLGYDCCPSFVVQCTATRVKVPILKWHWNLCFWTSEYWKFCCCCFFVVFCSFLLLFCLFLPSHGIWRKKDRLIKI